MLPETSSKLGMVATFSLLGVWLVACATGFFTLVSYSQTPGPDLVPTTLSNAGINWPREKDFLLVVAIHPRCVCSQATATGLQRLLERKGERLECRVLCYQPMTSESAFADTTLIEQLARLPNTTVVADADGLTASLLGMKTSGAMALFDRKGHPLFCGGITTARGHEGPSAGERAIVALVSRDRPTTTRTQVYGCPLANTTKPASSAVLSPEEYQP